MDKMLDKDLLKAQRIIRKTNKIQGSTDKWLKQKKKEKESSTRRKKRNILKSLKWNSKLSWMPGQVKKEYMKLKTGLLGCLYQNREWISQEGI